MSHAKTLIDGRKRGFAPKAGLFKARCRIPAWRPYDDLTDAQRTMIDEEAKRGYPYSESWHRELGNVVKMPCDFETDDRAAFEAHMKSPLHKDFVEPPLTANGRFAASIRRGWSNGLALKPEGRPFKASAKALADVVKTCPHCGLVAEVDGTTSSVLWWDEHLRGCALLVEGGAA